MAANISEPCSCTGKPSTSSRTTCICSPSKRLRFDSEPSYWLGVVAVVLLLSGVVLCDASVSCIMLCCIVLYCIVGENRANDARSEDQGHEFTRRAQH